MTGPEPHDVGFELAWYDLGTYLYGGAPARPAALDKEAQRILDVFRAAMAALASGVAVVTTRDDQDRPRGLTATSVTSYSAYPPSVLICIDRKAYSYQAMTQCKHFGVNLLAADQEELAMLFASKEPDKFERADWSSTEDGTPVLEGALAHLECRNAFVAEHGDHAVIIGSVVDGAASDRPPLVYWNRSFYRGWE